MGFLKSLLEGIKKLFGQVAEPDPASSKTFIEELTDLVKPVVEDLFDVDLDGDGVIATIADVRVAAEEFGLRKLKRLADGLAFSLDAGEAKRLLAITRLLPIAAPVLARFGLKVKYHYLELAVAAAFAIVAALRDGE
jgi:hypothetical protein